MAESTIDTLFHRLIIEIFLKGLKFFTVVPSFYSKVYNILPDTGTWHSRSELLFDNKLVYRHWEG